MKRGGLNDLLFQCGHITKPGVGPRKCCSLALARGWAGETGDQALSGDESRACSLLLSCYCTDDGGVCCCLCWGMSTLRKVKAVTRVRGRGGGVRRWGGLLIGARKRAHGKLIKPSAACSVSKRAAADTYSTAGGFIRASAGARC